MVTIKEKFAYLRKENKKAFIPYVPFGFPTITQSSEIILALQDCGADIIEVGIPFSDPIADGPIIQQASSQALKAGATTKKLFSTLSALKETIRIPLVIMTYYNPVMRFGIHEFFSAMKTCGVSGILTVDLPPDEDNLYNRTAGKFDRETIFLITPTTTLARAKKIIKATRGFLYYVSITGITGPHALNLNDVRHHIMELQKISTLPVCVGFGIHTRRQIRQIQSFSDGVIVGSSIVGYIQRNHRRKSFYRDLKHYVHSLCMK